MVFTITILYEDRIRRSLYEDRNGYDNIYVIVNIIIASFYNIILNNYIYLPYFSSSNLFSFFTAKETAYKTYIFTI